MIVNDDNILQVSNEPYFEMLRSRKKFANIIADWISQKIETKFPKVEEVYATAINQNDIEDHYFDTGSKSFVNAITIDGVTHISPNVRGGKLSDEIDKLFVSVEKFLNDSIAWLQKNGVNVKSLMNTDEVFDSGFFRKKTGINW